MKRYLLPLIAISIASGQTPWKAGAAKVNVTPKESIWLSGYASRTRPSDGVLQDIFVKAAAFQDADGKPSVILTSDLQGFDVAMIENVSSSFPEIMMSIEL